MTKPSKWDLKTWGVFLSIFGVTSFGTFLSQAQRITGWMASPSIQAAQAEGIRRASAADSVRMDELKTWIYAENKKTRKSIGDLRETLNEVKGFKEADAKRRARQTAREDLEINRSIVDDRSSFRALKGDRIP